jgi:FKBP-type peptidyl-prolyl cis-trans isomerase FklB
MAIRSMMVVGMALLAGVAAGQDAPALKSEKERQPVVKGEVRLKNQKEGEAFLAGNKTKEGVVTLESGLQYKILKAGDGKKPAAGDTVVCHYRGTLIDGTEFANTYKSNQPATFPVTGVIRGWKQSLQLMPAGSKWQLFIPARLAYGRRKAGHVIGPNSTLIYEVELLAIKEPPTAGESAPASNQADPAKSDLGKKDEPAKSPEPSAGTLSGIQISFKLDPRLSGPTYGGEHWVSPLTYTGVTAQDTVEVRIEGIGPKGQPVKISPKWTPSDPEMVTVSPEEGSSVKITVKRAGESSLKVTAQGVSRDLSIKAETKGGAIQVSITPEPLTPTPKTEAGQ